MKSIIVLVFVTAGVVLPFRSPAQTPEPITTRANSASVGLSAGRATASGYNYAYGGDLRFQHDFKGILSGLASVGYNSFRSATGHGPLISHFEIIPMKLGLKVAPIRQYYMSLEGGVGAGQFAPGTSSIRDISGKHAEDY